MIKLENIDGEKEVTAWITGGLTQTAIRYAELFGKELTAPTTTRRPGGDRYQALTTTQIRNVFGEVRRIQLKGFNEVDLLLLKPRLAYATERQGSQGSRDFRKVIDKALDAVLSAETTIEKQKRFKTFTDFFEAILAYHRAFGGK